METLSSLLGRNIALNLAGQIAVVIAAVVAIPFIARGLGTEEFGVLSLVWVLLGSFSLFDLGLGRATTKFVAEYLSRDQVARLPGLIWTSLGLHLLVGSLGGILLASTVPLLVGKILRVPVGLTGEVTTTFFILAAALPVVLGTTALRAVLEAAQRFDLVNLVKVPLNLSTFLIPVAAISLGFRLADIAVFLLVARFCAVAAYLMLCLRALSFLKQSPQFDLKVVRALAAYGGWVSVSNVLTPILVYADRFLIGSLVSIAAVAYYAAPFQMVTGLWIVPSSFAATLFPAFSALLGAGARQNTDKLYARSVKYLLLLLGPPVLLLVLFAEAILRLWMGGDFAEKSSFVLQILALGVLVNSLGWVSSSLLQGFGRPDIVAKVHVVELPLYIGAALLLIGKFGVDGAALAWASLMAVDATLMFGACLSLRLISLHTFAQNGFLRTIVGLVALGLMLFLTLGMEERELAQPVLALALVVLFTIAAWGYLLDRGERGLITTALRTIPTTIRKVR